MKPWVVLLLFGCSAAAVAQSYYGTNYVLSAPPAGQTGSTAVSMNDPAIRSWASAYTNMVYGDGVSDAWKTPGNALGEVKGLIDEGIVSLGRAGEITLLFPRGISDGIGDDFAVFENSFSYGFLELAYVEVSSDGINFTRFPNYSYTEESVPAFGANMFGQLLWGLGGKYRSGYGTPFDLAELQLAYDAIQAGQTDFSPEFSHAFTNTFQSLDLQRITHVRLVDVVGDGNSPDSRGEPIYDPYQTAISAGFDLDGVGVLNEMQLGEEDIPVLSMIWSNSVLQVSCDVDSNWFSQVVLQTSTNLVDWVDVHPESQTLETNGSMVCIGMSASNATEESAYFRLELDTY